MKVALVIVNFHKAAMIVDGIRKLRRQQIAGDKKFVVVDNSVSPHEADVLRAELAAAEEFIVAPANLGYSRGVNLAASAAGHFDYVVLVSPDIVVDDDAAIQKMVDIMEADSSIGIVATIQRNQDGTLTEVARRYPSPIDLARRRLLRNAPNDLDLLAPLGGGKKKLVDVDWVQSSFMMVRGGLWRALGGLDERYFVFMADVDICKRAQENGARVVVTSEVSVQADGVRASRGGVMAIFRSKALRIHLRDAFVYYLRNGFFGTYKNLGRA